MQRQQEGVAKYCLNCGIEVASHKEADWQTCFNARARAFDLARRRITRDPRKGKWSKREFNQLNDRPVQNAIFRSGRGDSDELGDPQGSARSCHCSASRRVAGQDDAVAH